MKITIHRGTHQIGGIATEISTDTTRIMIDMGDELSLEPGFVSAPLEIPGVTDTNGSCDAVFLTHYHGDHVGQVTRIRDGIPIYAGNLAKEILKISEDHRRQKNVQFLEKVTAIQTFSGGETLQIGDIRITPWSIDHSACDSYLFLIETQGKRILYTGDFRMHGFRGRAIPKILRKIGKVDVLITEGTTISRQAETPLTERELQQQVRAYMEQCKYVYVLCSSTNLERICALSKAVPRGKYFVCDKYQSDLLDLIQKYWSDYSELYRNIKKTTSGSNLLSGMREKGFLMIVRDNQRFREILSRFDPAQGIILYSMWDGYRTKENSTIPSFLSLAGRWEYLHTSGHAAVEDIQRVIDISDPDIVIPMHTDDPYRLQNLHASSKIIVLKDGMPVVI